MKDAHAYPGVDINFDYNLVRIKVHAHLKAMPGKTKILWKRETLKEKEMESKFNAEVLNLIKGRNDILEGIEAMGNKYTKIYCLEQWNE